jgi:hypothetical protein
MTPAFIELQFSADDCERVGIMARDEIEDELTKFLDCSELCCVSGGGGGMGRYNIDVDVFDERRLDEVVSLLQTELRRLNVPRSSTIVRHKPVRQVFPVYP